MSKSYVLLVAVALSFPVLADTTEEKISLAMSAAPAHISGEATIQDDDGTLLRKGSNGYTCMPGSGSPMCSDAVWGKLDEAMKNKADFSTDRIGISYMMQGDSEPGSNDSPDATDQTKGAWVKEGPHLMIIVPKELLKGLPSDPASGLPYIMWQDTPYAHIMVPVGARK
jgi:hypothetical protein